MSSDNIAFGRYLRLEVAGLKITELRVDFDVKKNSESNANETKISIFNLNKSSRNKITEIGKGRIKLFVGYVSIGTDFLLVDGNIDDVEVSKQGRDIITEIIIKEGGKELDDSYFNKSYAKKTPKRKIIKDALLSLKLDAVLSDDMINKILDGVDEIDEELKNGSTFSQKTKKVLDNFLGLAGISWSIQNGEVVILKENDVIENEIYKIGSQQGLIGFPKKTEKGYDIETILLPEIKVGGRIDVESEIMSGIYKIVAFNSVGSLYSDQWKSSINLIGLD